MRRGVLLVVAALVVGFTLVPQASAERRAAGTPFRDPYVNTRGYLTPAGPMAYERAKAAINAQAGIGSNETETAGPNLPVPGPSWSGENDTSVTPPDPTGAVGHKVYIELVNLRYGIYDKAAGALISDGGLDALTGHPLGCLADPQIIWDTGQARFFYVVLDFCTNMMAWGFSKTDTPLANTDFCPYTADFGYGADLPDYPRLGDTKDFLLIGVNRFAGGIAYAGSDLLWINKTGASSACPPASTFGLGKFSNLKLCNQALAFTPVPAVMTDVTPNGFLLATENVGGGAIGSFIAVYGVRPDPANPTVPQISPPHCVVIPNYKMPADAQQCSSTKLLDTLDGRLKQAVMARDPAQGNNWAIWTTHSVLGGPGSKERWYEIRPLPLAAPGLWQPVGNVASTAALRVERCHRSRPGVRRRRGLVRHGHGARLQHGLPHGVLGDPDGVEDRRRGPVGVRHGPILAGAERGLLVRVRGVPVG